MSSIASQRSRGPSLEAVRVLVSQARSGDRAAFLKLYRSANPTVTAYVRYRVPRHVPVEDLVQDVWVRAWSALPRLAHLSNPLGWLFTIARNVIADQAKSAWVQRTVVAEPPDDRPDPAPGPEDQVLAAADRDADLTLLARLVGALTDDQARVVRADLAGCSTAQTAATLNLTIGAVKAYRYRALRRMRRVAAAAQLTPVGVG